MWLFRKPFRQTLQARFTRNLTQSARPHIRHSHRCHPPRLLHRLVPDVHPRIRTNLCEMTRKAILIVDSRKPDRPILSHQQAVVDPLRIRTMLLHLPLSAKLQTTVRVCPIVGRRPKTLSRTTSPQLVVHRGARLARLIVARLKKPTHTLQHLVAGLAKKLTISVVVDQDINPFEDHRKKALHFLLPKGRHQPRQA